jgi:hypothetical protein
MRALGCIRRSRLLLALPGARGATKAVSVGQTLPRILAAPPAELPGPGGPSRLSDPARPEHQARLFLRSAAGTHTSRRAPAVVSWPTVCARSATASPHSPRDWAAPGARPRSSCCRNSAAR